jgi:hypothetical protein
MLDQDERRRAASEKIAELLREIDDKRAEAMKIADDAGVYFTLGGSTYYGRGRPGEPTDIDEEYGPDEDGTYAHDYNGRWVSSSERC